MSVASGRIRLHLDISFLRFVVLSVWNIGGVDDDEYDEMSKIAQ